MTDREFINELKMTIRPDDAPVLVSKETFEDMINLMKPKKVTEIIQEVKDEFCNDFCKRKEECAAKLDGGEWFDCPLDRL